MRESIEDGRTGFLFRNGDARHLAAVLGAALASPEARRRVREASLEQVRRWHDWAWIGRMTADCYRTL
jgi:glycosyltransferase involved in cell wall biosynthesis